MAIVKTLAVSVVSRTKGFQQGMSKSTRKLRGFKREATLASRALGGLRSRFASFGAGVLGGALGTLAVGNLIAFSQRATEASDSLIKFAQRLGTTPKVLAGFELAGQRAGASTEQLRMGLQRLVRKIGDAADGSTEASKAFERLGLDWRDLIRLDLPDQFDMVARALLKSGSAASLLSRTVKFVDSEGAGLVPLFRNLEIVAKSLADASRIGFAIPQGEINKIQKAADSIGDLKKAFEGAKFEFSAKNSENMIAFNKALENSLPLWTKLLELTTRVGTAALTSAANMESLVNFVRIGVPVLLGRVEAIEKAPPVRRQKVVRDIRGNPVSESGPSIPGLLEGFLEKRRGPMGPELPRGFFPQPPPAGSFAPAGGSVITNDAQVLRLLEDIRDELRNDRRF